MAAPIGDLSGSWLMGQPKRKKNLADRGLDFADLTQAFFHNAMIVRVKNSRHMAIGSFDGQMISVVFAKLAPKAFRLLE
jgi:uncharacterized DUF497 family protein